MDIGAPDFLAKLFLQGDFFPKGLIIFLKSKMSRGT
jgi:hypothetical protein